jgi:hypothetical protein
VGPFNEQVRRNADRFPGDFMFRLSAVEATALRSQIATSRAVRGGRRYLPYAFTEQGVAMLSSVLHSERAVRVNIEIMRAFHWVSHVASVSVVWPELERMMSSIAAADDRHGADSTTEASWP